MFYMQNILTHYFLYLQAFSNLTSYQEQTFKNQWDSNNSHYVVLPVSKDIHQISLPYKSQTEISSTEKGLFSECGQIIFDCWIFDKTLKSLQIGSYMAHNNNSVKTDDLGIKVSFFWTRRTQNISKNLNVYA